jgi:hypothetical protein
MVQTYQCIWDKLVRDDLDMVIAELRWMIQLC